MPIACSALFEFLLIFSYSKNIKFSWSLEEFHLQIALNLQKYALFLFKLHTCSASLKYTLASVFTLSCIDWFYHLLWLFHDHLGKNPTWKCSSALKYNFHHLVCYFDSKNIFGGTSLSYKIHIFLNLIFWTETRQIKRIQ